MIVFHLACAVTRLLSHIAVFSRQGSEGQIIQTLEVMVLLEILVLRVPPRFWIGFSCHFWHCCLKTKSKGFHSSTLFCNTLSVPESFLKHGWRWKLKIDLIHSFSLLHLPACPLFPSQKHSSPGDWEGERFTDLLTKVGKPFHCTTSRRKHSRFAVLVADCSAAFASPGAHRFPMTTEGCAGLHSSSTT